MRVSRARFKDLQDKLLDAPAKIPPDLRDRSPVGKRLAKATTPLQSSKQYKKGTQLIQTGSQTRTRSSTQDRRELQTEQLEQASPASPTTLRKRQLDDDNEHHPKWARLTQRNLARFDKMGKRNGQAAPIVDPLSTKMTSTKMTSTKTTSTTTSGFALQAYKNGILSSSFSKPPANLDVIRKRVAASRGTASPTPSDYEDYVRVVGRASNEAAISHEVCEGMLKRYKEDGHRRGYNQAFTAFPKDVGLNNGLSAPHPDFVEGLEMRSFHPFPVDEHVSGAVLCEDDPSSLTLPHLAGEFKSRKGNMATATLQSSYDGAALVYARREALSYLGKPDLTGNAEVTTFTTDGTNITLYAHYAVQSEDGTLVYHQYPITSANLIKSHQDHNEGRRGLRNEQDHAKRQSEALRDQLKEHWKQSRKLPIPDDTHQVDEVSNNEDEALEQPYQLIPAASSRSHKESHSSSKPLPLDDAIENRNQNRKATLRNYWKKDAKSRGLLSLPF